MTRDSRAHSELGDGKSSSPPNMVREEIQPSQAETAQGIAETTVTGMEKEGLDPEKAVHTQNSIPSGNSGTVASKTAPDLRGSTANPASNNLFGEEDNEYISGCKLYVALFGIVAVFFLVLLDFSITATVSAGGFLDPMLPHSCQPPPPPYGVRATSTPQAADKVATYSISWYRLSRTLPVIFTGCKSTYPEKQLASPRPYHRP